MKIQILNVLTKVGLLSAMLLVTSVASVQGQSLSNKITANIPFDFSVGEKKLPAGKYSVRRLNQSTGDGVVSVSEDDGRANALRLSIATQRSRPDNKAILVFHQYGDQYFLFQVWPAGATTGRQFPRSQREKDIQQNVAGSLFDGKKSETVTIVGVLQ
jgi:hypothetical protein